MDDFEKLHDYFEQVAAHTAPANPPMEEKQESPVNITRRLRDRALLKRKKEEAQDKDTIYEQTRSKRQQRGKATGRGRKKIEAKELEPEPKQAVEPERELQPETEPESASVPEPEPEVNVPQEQAENAQEHSQYYDDPVTVTEHVAPLVHEEADVHGLQDKTSLLTEKEAYQETVPEQVAEVPEVLSFHVDAEEEEPQYYTPLL
ncbi:hemogen [Bombina bombina]|uniref:hemogen n=1 Tax=Bombina bombina TaxID=8345 RepID=UPI00235AFCA7|nr:hemogen [Bombina bombina]